MFSPDGHEVAAGNADGRVRLWDVTDPRHPQQVATLTTSTSTSSLAFSPDNHTLAVAGDDYSELLETDADHAASHVCELAWPPITADEWSNYFPGFSYQPPCAPGTVKRSALALVA
jgi:WD40 repeat protein